MAADVEAVLERRRLRRRVTTWRVIAILLAMLAATAVIWRGSADMGAITGAKQIARVPIHGLITDDRKRIALLKRIASDDSVAAVLLDVNSPGGTTTGGEALFEAIREVAEKKPVVAVFGTIATSAAYIVGLASDRIVARGNTITGSVGVIMQWAELGGLMEKLGVRMNEIKSGRLKANPSPFEPLNEDGRRLLEEMIAESQQWFLGLVSDRRKLTPATVPGLVEGAVFSGRAALEHGLIDAVGAEAQAIAWLEADRGVPVGLKVVEWAPKQDDFLGLIGSVAGLAGWIFGPSGQQLVDLLQDRATINSVQLDGLVSVWHPQSN